MLFYHPNKQLDNKNSSLDYFFFSFINNSHISLLSGFHRLEDINGALSANHHVTYCYFTARNLVLCDEQQKH